MGIFDWFKKQKKSNKVEDVIKNEQSNSEERLEIITDGKVYRVTGSENIRKTKELSNKLINNKGK